MEIPLFQNYTSNNSTKLVMKFVVVFAIFWIIWWILEWIAPEYLERIDNIITHFVTYSAAIIQNGLHDVKVTVGGPHNGQPWSLIDGNTSVVRIGDACNGRNLIVLYLSFLLALPIGEFENKILFAFFGVIFILLMNILRIYGLFHVAREMPEFFQFLHKYIFQTFIYLDMYLLWRAYLHFEIKKKKKYKYAV